MSRALYVERGVGGDAMHGRYGEAEVINVERFSRSFSETAQDRGLPCADPQRLAATVAA